MRKSFLFVLGFMMLTLSWPAGVTAGTSGGGRSFSVHEMNLLEGWLGKNVSLNTLYSRKTGDTPLAFHAAVDAVGPTFVVMDVTITSAGTNLGKNFVVGGYNPQAWTSNGGYVNTTTLGLPRDAFVFNLTTETAFFQNPVPSSGTDFGAYQTYNAATYGPSFGSSDLWTTNNSLMTGYSRVKSYGLDAALWGGAAWNGTILPGNGTSTVSFNINSLDVYAASPVPAPATVLLLSSGLAGLLGMQFTSRKKKE